LNVAGPRSSNWPGAAAYAEEVVHGIIQSLRS
jgi:hypothetical protein